MTVWAPIISSPQLTRKQAADKLGLPFDIRTVSQVVADLRREGVDALPSVSRSWYVQPEVRKRFPEGLLPLSQLSRALIVECNERGDYLTYRTDNFGFNNPPDLLAAGAATKAIDMAVVGESNAVSDCLPTEQSLVGRLRLTWPRTPNFAMSGTHGHFVALIVPLYAEVVAQDLPPALRHAHLRTVLAREGIDVIDGAALFLRHPDPASLYTMRINNHPTPEGYALLSDYVREHLATTETTAGKVASLSKE